MARFPMTKTLTRITVTGQDGEHQLQIEDGSGEVAVYHQIRADPSACRGSRRSARGGGRGAGQELQEQIVWAAPCPFERNTGVGSQKPAGLR